MRQLCDEAIRLLKSGESFVQATILKSSGSVPRGAGASMLILNDGGIVDTVGGGALEGGIIKAAPDVYRAKCARVIEIVLDGNDAVAVGMICGGSATVLLDYIDADNPGNLEFFEQLDAVLRTGAQAEIVTALPDSGAARSQCLRLLGEESALKGTSGIRADVLSQLQNGKFAKDVTVGGEETMFFSRVGDATVYIFGAGHCGEKLEPVLRYVGFRTVVVDDRAEFANRERFPDANEILVPESMDKPFESIKFTGDSYVVIVTRGHAHDELVLRGAVKSGAGYVGMIGSKRKRESIYARLLSDGYAQADIDKVYAPIGIPIGDETPEEIAISITAQLIKVRAERRAQPI